MLGIHPRSALCKARFSPGLELKALLCKAQLGPPGRHLPPRLRVVFKKTGLRALWGEGF